MRNISMLTLMVKRFIIIHTLMFLSTTDYAWEGRLLPSKHQHLSLKLRLSDNLVQEWKDLEDLHVSSWFTAMI